MDTKSPTQFKEELNEMIKNKFGTLDSQTLEELQKEETKQVDSIWRKAAVMMSQCNAQTTEKPVQVVVIGKGGKTADIEALRKTMEQNPNVLIIDNLTEEKIREVATAVGQSFGKVKEALMEFTRTVQKTSIKIENFRIPELNDIYITDQSLPRDAKGFGMSKLGINQRNNFKHRRR